MKQLVVVLGYVGGADNHMVKGDVWAGSFKGSSSGKLRVIRSLVAGTAGPGHFLNFAHWANFDTLEQAFSIWVELCEQII